MKHITSILWFYTLAGSLLSSCGFSEPPCDSAVYPYKLTSDQKSKVPYTGNDTLVFISSMGDTAAFVGLGQQNGYTEEQMPGRPGCSYFNQYEYVKYPYAAIGANELQPLELGVYYKFEPDRSHGLMISIKNKTYFVNTSYLDNSKYTDTAVINNITYSGFKLMNSTSFTEFVFFNHTAGILRYYDQHSNKTWDILIH